MKPIQTAVTVFALTSSVELCRVQSAASYAPQSIEKGEVTWAQVVSPSASTLFKEALTKQEHEDFRGAIASYTEFLKANPNHAEAYSNRGFSKAMLDDLRGALLDFDRAIELEPNNADAYNGRGNVNAMSGNLPASIRDFNRSIRCNRNFADAYYNRAISRHGLGDRRGARSDLAQAAKLFQQQQDIGGYQQVQEWMEKLKK